MATPIAQLDPACVWQPDLQAAAIEALRRLPAKEQEQGGVIFSKDGQYCYSTPVLGGDHSFQARVRIPDGAKLAALYHTHPEGHIRKGDRAKEAYFSGNDITQADQLKLDSFIRILRDNSYRRYTPGVSKVSKGYDPDSQGTLIGEN